MEFNPLEVNRDLYDMIFTTVQSNAIKLVIESIKDILSDAHLVIDEHGVQILSMDGNKICIVHLKLVAKKFESFYARGSIRLGINIKSLHSLLRTIGNNDVITMYTERGDGTKLHIIIENKERNMCDRSKLRLLDFDEDVFLIPDIEFDFIISMPSSDFQKICKDLYHLSNIITIKSENKKFIMSVKGDIGEKEVIIQERINAVAFPQTSEHCIEDRFNLQYLVGFVKCTNLSSDMKIFIKKGFPLILLYDAGSLGEVKFVLSAYIENSSTTGPF